MARWCSSSTSRTLQRLYNVWIEHAVPAIWTANVDEPGFSNLRLRNLFADGINLNNDSRNNTVRNSESRSSGDDSFAMFNAQDRMAGINSCTCSRT